MALEWQEVPSVKQKGPIPQAVPLACTTSLLSLSSEGAGPPASVGESFGLDTELWLPFNTLTCFLWMSLTPGRGMATTSLLSAFI